MDLSLIRIFVKVIQNGGFSKAAENLKLPKSTVSKAVARLEHETKTHLITRTTRSLTLTAAGRQFYESCLAPVQALEDAGRSLYGSDQILSGSIRLTAPEDLGSTVIAPALGLFIRKHPEIRFDLHYTDEVIDLVKDGFDLAIRVGKLRESSLKAKKVGEIFLIAVASPEYIKSNPRIRSPQDLANHPCLSISVRGLSDQWVMRSKKESLFLKLSPHITSNQMTSLLNMAIAGAGIALVPGYLCSDSIKKGALIRVLPDWASPGIPVSLITPTSSTSSVRLKTVFEYLFNEVKTSLDRA